MCDFDQGSLLLRVFRLSGELDLLLEAMLECKMFFKLGGNIQNTKKL